MHWQMPLRDLDWVFLILKHVHCIIKPTPMTIFLVLCVSAVRWWKSFLVLVFSHWRCKITVFATNHTFPNPWPWINNCIEQWSERVFLFNWVTLPFNWSGEKTWNNSVQHRWIILASQLVAVLLHGDMARDVKKVVNSLDPYASLSISVALVTSTLWLSLGKGP